MTIMDMLSTRQYPILRGRDIWSKPIFQFFVGLKSLFCFLPIILPIFGLERTPGLVQNVIQKFKLVMTPTLPNNIPNIQFSYSKRSIPDRKVDGGRSPMMPAAANSSGAASKFKSFGAVKTVKSMAKFKRIQK